MKRMGLLVIIVVLLSLLFAGLRFLPSAKATVLYVGGVGPGNYTSLQGAIDNATPHDTVYVYSGTYQESVVIDKTLTIVGEDRNTTMIDGGGIGDVVYVIADWVNFSGFTLVNGGPFGSFGGDSGIELDGAKNCHMFNNNVSSNRLGISLSNSEQNYVTGNIAMNTEIGILVWNAFWNKIVNNTISDNDKGIHFFGSWFDKVWDNRITLNGEGIEVVNSHNNLIHHNEFIANSKQAADIGTNQWDNGYPSGGNFWSDYSGVDEKNGPGQDQNGSDGIGDIPYDIAEGSSQDRYPLLRTPSSPEDLQAAPGDGTVNLTWSEPSLIGGVPITNYRVYRGISSGGETLLAEIDNATSYEDAGLENGQTYYYQISAINLVGEGARSNEVVAVPATLPGSPTELSASAGEGEVTLTWSPPVHDGFSPVVNYTIYRGMAPDEETFLITLGDVLRYEDTGLTNDVTYYYRVAAVNGIGEGLKSEEVGAIPHINQPPTCNITSPVSGTWISGIFEIQGTAFDLEDAILRVEIRISDGNWTQVEGASTWSYDWNTTAMPNGAYMVYARSFDGVYYSGEVSVTAVINNPVEPPPSDGDESDSQQIWLSTGIVYAIIAVLVLVAIVVLVFMVWLSIKRRRRTGGQ
ncbi:MAG: NosD domain-containing protein [Thermoplasmata archaeon]